MKFSRKPFEEPKLVLVPIVDVLLAVFLFLAILAFKEPFISVFVQLPSGNGEKIQNLPVNILIDAKGNIFLGKKKISFNELEKFLKEKNPTTVNIYADEKTPYKYIAEVLSLLQKLKIYGVNLVMKKKG